jgi:hypothetical protein
MFRVNRQNPAPPPAATHIPAARPAPQPAVVEAPQDALDVAAVPGHFETQIQANENQLPFLTNCAGFQNGKVSVDLSPQFWDYLGKSGTKIIEQEFVDSMLLAGVHASAATSTKKLLIESGTEAGHDLEKIEAQEKAARSALEGYKEAGKCNLGGTSRKVKKTYKKEFNGCDMDLDHNACKASQRFRESILKIAAMPAEKRQFETQHLIESQPKLSTAIVIALYRLNRSFV